MHEIKLEPGLYELTQDVAHPKSDEFYRIDRRQKHDWRYFALWKAGTRFVVKKLKDRITEKALLEMGQPLPPEGCFQPITIASEGAYYNDVGRWAPEIVNALVPNLVKLGNEVESWLRLERVGSHTLETIIVRMGAKGALKLEDLKAEYDLYMSEE